MKWVVVLTFFLTIVIGGGVFLSTRSIVPETHPVEKVLPNDKFIK